MALNLVVNPGAHCTTFAQFEYELEWVPEKHYAAGTEVELRCGLFRQYFEWKLHRLDMEKAEILYRTSATGGNKHQFRKERIVLKAKLLYAVAKSKPVRITIMATPAVYAGLDLELNVWTREPLSGFISPDAEPFPVLPEEGSSCILEAKPGPVERLSVYAHPQAGVGGTVRVSFVPEDRYGNPSQFAQPVSCTLQWAGTSRELTLSGREIVELSASEQVERAQLSIPMRGLSISENISNGERRDGHLVVTGNPVVPTREDRLCPAFGEIHWHTDAVPGADGGRSMDQAFASARDDLNLNFAAPSDHSPKGEEWTATVRSIDAFYEPNAFTTFYGWENSTNRGHENYYFLDPDHDVVCAGKSGFRGGELDKVREQLKDKKDFIAIPHHTNVICETRRADGVPMWHQYNWLEPNDYTRLIEIVQSRGNQERNSYPDAWCGWSQHNLASAQDALAQGHKLGFIGGTDNHAGWPGRIMKGEKTNIVTGLWTERQDRESIFRALWDRRTWAAWNTRALVEYKLNGHWMGSELQARGGESLTASIQITAEDVFQSVEIVSEGKTVWSASCADRQISVEVPLGLVERSTHFYLRALLRNGGFVLASPVFVELMSQGRI